MIRLHAHPFPLPVIKLADDTGKTEKERQIAGPERLGE
jgi:hypothetical protein